MQGERFERSKIYITGSPSAIACNMPPSTPKPCPFDQARVPLHLKTIIKTSIKKVFVYGYLLKVTHSFPFKSDISPYFA